MHATIQTRAKAIKMVSRTPIVMKKEDLMASARFVFDFWISRPAQAAAYPIG
jgi:hypothetical protein